MTQRPPGPGEISERDMYAAAVKLPIRDDAVRYVLCQTSNQVIRPRQLTRFYAGIRKHGFKPNPRWHLKRGKGPVPRLVGAGSVTSPEGSTGEVCVGSRFSGVSRRDRQDPAACILEAARKSLSAFQRSFQHHYCASCKSEACALCRVELTIVRLGDHTKINRFMPSPGTSLSAPRTRNPKPATPNR
jgi:hypothetical protein